MQSFCKWLLALKYDNNYIYTCIVPVANKTNTFTSGDLKTIVS